MATTGKIMRRNGKLYVMTVFDEFSEPFRQYIWYRILELHRNRYNMQSPDEGDEVTFQWDGRWTTVRGGHVITAAGADDVERVSVLAPASRGKPLRWYDGRWERLMAKGWVAAGEGAPHPRRRGAKTKRELNLEIARATGIKLV